MKAALPAPALSGVYRAPGHVAAIRDSLAATGARWFAVDLHAVRTKRDLLETLTSSLGTPAGFGYNWDALADVLQDLSWHPATGYVLHLSAGATAARTLGADWSTFLEILTASAMYWKTRDKPFIALIDDAGALPPWI